MQGNAPVSTHFNTGKRGFRSGAKVFLHAPKAHAVALTWVFHFKFGFAFRTLEPDFIFRRFRQHFIHANRPGRNGTLGVFHAGFQRVAHAKFNRVNIQLRRDFIHHHFGGGHTL
ncbi:hypothetical protein D3C75_792610 [compost metagenome]